jgi:heptosyltransferase I
MRHAAEGAAHSTCNAPASHPPAGRDRCSGGIACPDPHKAYPMSRALIIRPSSLGDIVHALPIVHDIRRHRPGIAIDWVAEEAFAALVAMHRGVDRVIPVALRRWRHKALERATWREAAAFRRALIRDRYDFVLDLQEQVKGALVAWLARGPVHGPDRASIREPAASLTYRHRYRIDPAQHLIDRCRQLAAAAFGYTPEGPPHFDLTPPALLAAPETPYAVFVHASSRADKLWPEAYWRTLIAHFTQAGLAVLLPWGTTEEAKRSARLADGIPGAAVCARRELPELAALLARAEVVCGVDTGLVHLAAALGAPTVALFVATDPRLAGVARASPRCRDLGGNRLVPTPVEVIAAVGALLRSLPSC